MANNTSYWWYVHDYEEIRVVSNAFLVLECDSAPYKPVIVLFKFIFIFAYQSLQRWQFRWDLHGRWSQSWEGRNQCLCLFCDDLLQWPDGDAVQRVLNNSNHSLNQSTCFQVAVKFEKENSRCPQLRHEYKVYRELVNCHGFCCVSVMTVTFLAIFKFTPS